MAKREASRVANSRAMVARTPFEVVGLVGADSNRTFHVDCTITSTTTNPNKVQSELLSQTHTITYAQAHSIGSLSTDPLTNALSTTHSEAIVPIDGMWREGELEGLILWHSRSTMPSECRIPAIQTA